MKDANDFKTQVDKLKLGHWPLRGCSICGYMIGYLFKDGGVFFDAGCDCVSYSSVQPRTWEDVAKQYNDQTSQDTIYRYDLFWGFIDD